MLLVASVEESSKAVEGFNFNALLNVSSLLLSLLSVGIGLFSIWLTFKLKLAADELNRKTMDLLTKLEIETGLLSRMLVGEITKNNDLLRDLAKAGPVRDNTVVRSDKAD